MKCCVDQLNPPSLRVAHRKIMSVRIVRFSASDDAIFSALLGEQTLRFR